MALFTDAVIADVAQRIWRRYQTLGKALGMVIPVASAEVLPETSELVRRMRLLISVANGEHARASTSEELLMQIEEARRWVVGLLFGNVWGALTPIPDDFWRTDIGVLISRVGWWLAADELITISNAAALAFGENTQANRMRIARAIENGTLEWYLDPSVANPQQNRRVLRPQVERLREIIRWPPE
jgi:hypothetical protein